jgi:two-component system, chemotaxis family, sensor histidine kinase and response regulator WspE
MTELFRLEAESQTQLLSESLLALERTPTAADHLEACMRAAHSLKGAARLVGISPAVVVAHAMEDCLVAAQRGAILLGSERIDLLLEGVDLLSRTASSPADSAGNDLQADADRFTARLAALLTQGGAPTADVAAGQPVAPAMPANAPAALHPVQPFDASPASRPEERRVLRVTAENFDRVLGLAGESLVQSRRFKSALAPLSRLRRQYQDGAAMLERLGEMRSRSPFDAHAHTALEEMRAWLADCRDQVATQFAMLEVLDNRSTDLARRLYDEALACRMRPFADGVAGFPKMVRNLARSLGKEARLQVVGEATEVDRDVLETLESPLSHLLRNAVDHGIEAPAARLAAGKPVEGLIRLEASHAAGVLQILVSDDGQGVDPDRVRTAVVVRNLAQPAVAETLSEAELLEFLFLPGFTMKQTVTEISGRGVGLDAVRSMVKQVRGTIRITSRAGHGTSFELRLPLTLSVLRTLLADVGGEAYAFPLAQIARAATWRRREIELIESKPHIRFEGRLVGLVNAAQVFGGPPPADQDVVSIVLLGEADEAVYGLIVDRFLGERETVVQPLDSRLGTIADILAGGVMEDGTPILIVDVEDSIRSIEKMSAGGTLRAAAAPPSPTALQLRPRKRVLVVDDSLTVRELERKLLDQAGYVVETAVDGIEGWNMVRSGRFDLTVTDVDMPRMDGIELVRLIKGDPNLGSLPVMIVSYKDEEMDRRRGLEAGADYYLPKAGFDDDTLLQAVRDLIGEAAA